jgi:ATP-dependent Clp protease ATP-binding subunit ClpA
MSEYSESYTVSKLIGSAPGYVGYDEQNSALERIRRHPYSVVLLDEIEKAHPDVLSLFLQIFDTGYLTDASGRKISFKNTYIIMTSNIGADKFRGAGEIGFMNEGEDKSLHKRLRPHFKDEFINRIDEIILFEPLSASALKEIAKMKISSVTERLVAAKKTLICEENIYDLLVDMSRKNGGFGARPLIRLIVSEIENKIARLIISEAEDDIAEQIIIYEDNGKIACKRLCPAVK